MVKDPTIAQYHSVYDTASGLIVGWGFGLPVVEPGQDWIEGEYHGDLFWRNPATSNVEPRPDLIEPQVSGNVVTFPGLPPETSVTVTNTEGEQLTFAVSDGPLMIDDPGRYHLSVDPPLPWRRWDGSMDIA